VELCAGGLENANEILGARLGLRVHEVVCQAGCPVLIERSVILCTGDTFRIDQAWLLSKDGPRPKSSVPLTQTLQSYEKELIESALAESKGKISGSNGAAVKLGIPPSTLHLKIKQLNVKKSTI
jgi:DNA-binding NtrC family response regulator